MEITTKFNINDLVAHKYDVSPEDQKTAMEVIEIQTVTCSDGTQTFYHCRLIIAMREFKGRNATTQEKEYTWKVAHAITGKDTVNPYQRYREDEIMASPSEVTDLICPRAEAF